MKSVSETRPITGSPNLLPIEAVVMVGGYGNRLRAVSNNLPKTLLPVGDRPLLELVLHQLREAGIRRVYLATHYKAELFAQRYGNGEGVGLEIRYLREDQPLGTAGALSLLPKSEQPFLVMNGDILARVRFGDLWEFHQAHHATMTIAVHQHAVTIPYGVVETDGVRVVHLREKPVMKHCINAGIYLLSPQALQVIPSNQRYDMTDLIGQLLADGALVVSFPFQEQWWDIGDIENYRQAVRDFQTPLTRSERHDHDKAVD